MEIKQSEVGFIMLALCMGAAYVHCTHVDFACMQKRAYFEIIRWFKWFRDIFLYVKSIKYVYEIPNTCF